MRKLLTFLMALAAIVFAAGSPTHADGMAIPGVPTIGGNAAYSYPPSPPAGGCTQATAFIARASLTGSDATNYTNLICGLVTSGTWAKLDVLHIYASPAGTGATTALMNLVSTSFSATAVGSPTFTAHQGFLCTVNGTAYMNMGYNPSTAGGVYTQNSASYGYYDRTSNTGTANFIIGATDGTNKSEFAPNNGGTDYIYVNTTGFPGVPAVGNNQGLRVVSRTSSSVALYAWYSTTNSGLVNSAQTDTSSAITNNNFFSMAYNNNGTAAGGATDEVAADFAGGALTSTDAANLSTYINGYMTANGKNVY